MKHEAIECRQATRRPTYITGSLKKGTMNNPCWVRDISSGGALVFAEVPLDRGDRVIMTVDAKAFAAYVRWIDYPLAGLQFEDGSLVSARGSKAAEPVTDIRGLRSRLSSGSEHGWLGRMRRRLGGL